MSLIVQKFGGTSVGDIERIEQVADKVARFRGDGHSIVVVVSAMSGETNRLIEMAHEVQDRPVPREMDVLISTGEQVTTALLSMALNERGVKAKAAHEGEHRRERQLGAPTLVLPFPRRRNQVQPIGTAAQEDHNKERRGRRR